MARQNGCPWNEITCRSAVIKGHLEVLIWARTNGAPWQNDHFCTSAASGGHLEMLKWLRANPWDEQTCAMAYEEGHFEVLQWVRENGCPWHTITSDAGRYLLRYPVLLWALDNGAPTNQLKFLKWYRKEKERAKQTSAATPLHNPPRLPDRSRIIVKYDAGFGNMIEIRGAVKATLSWNAGKALICEGGNHWEINLPKVSGDFEFKITLRKEDGSVLWEKLPKNGNRTFESYSRSKEIYPSFDSSVDYKEPAMS